MVPPGFVGFSRLSACRPPKVALRQICAATDELGDVSSRRAAYRQFLDQCELRDSDYGTIADKLKALSQ